MGMDLTLAGIAGAARSWLDRLQSETAAAGAPGRALNDALNQIVGTIATIETAKNKAAGIVTAPQFSVQYKWQQARDLTNAAYTGAMNAVDALDRAIGSAQQQLTRGKPAKPADSSMAAFTASECVKVLEGAGDAVAAAHAAASMLATAIANGDETLAWVLSGGPLDLTYRRLGAAELVMPLFEQEYAKSPAATNDGAALLAHLRQGGSGTLAGLVVAARYVVTHDQALYTDWLTNSVRSGTFQGVADRTQVTQ